MPAPSRPLKGWFDRLKPPGRRGVVPASLLASLILLTVAAWWLTLYQAASMNMPMGVVVRGGMGDDGMAGMAMAGISSPGWSIEAAIAFTAIWTVMMAAMMLPAAAPMIFMFASAQARRSREVAVPTWIFVSGYLLVWAAAGLVVYVVVQVGSELAAGLTLAERSRWVPIALGATVITAGLYQFAPLKRLCLAYCRSPFAFIAQHWRDGRGGAMAMGLRHGVYCLGCCWALFAVLVAAGVMSIAWMLLLTLVVAAEKLLPHGRTLSAAMGVVLMVLGGLVAGGAVTMPGLSHG